MNWMHTGRILVSFGMLMAGGCASAPFPESSLTGAISEVRIGDAHIPKVMTAKPGDEVRWVNMTSDPIDVSFSDPIEGRVSCQKGFASVGWGYLFGGTELDFLVVATVQSHDFASLCFSTPGTYRYTVHMDKTAIGRSTRIPATVKIE